MTKIKIPSKTKVLLSIFLCILSISCKKDKIGNPRDLIADGCIPKTITSDDSIFGETVTEYIYDFGSFSRYGSFNIEYEDGLVSEIRLTNTAYEEYFYNDQFQVKFTIKYRYDSSEKEFVSTDIKEYRYDGNRMVEIFDMDDFETIKISYYPNTNNIDSVKTFNSDLELLEFIVCKYDESNNPNKNLLMPRFDYSVWFLQNGSENNLTQRKWVRRENQLDTLIDNYEHQYNSYDYPTETIRSRVNTNFAWKKTITYMDCN